MAGFKRYQGKRVANGVIKLSGSIDTPDDLPLGSELLVVGRFRVAEDKHITKDEQALTKVFFTHAEVVAIAPDDLRADLASAIESIEQARMADDLGDDDDDDE